MNYFTPERYAAFAATKSDMAIAVKSREVQSGLLSEMSGKAEHLGRAMGDYFEGFLNEEAKQLGQTLDQLKAWQPRARTSGRGRRRTT